MGVTVPRTSGQSLPYLVPRTRYYRNWTRNNIATFNDEDDPERLQQLLQKGEEHRVWIMKKYHLKDIPGNR